MSAAANRLTIATLVRAAIADGAVKSFCSIDADAEDFLDRQGSVVLIRRIGPREYLISPRVKR